MPKFCTFKMCYYMAIGPQSKLVKMVWWYVSIPFETSVMGESSNGGVLYALYPLRLLELLEFKNSRYALMGSTF